MNKKRFPNVSLLLLACVLVWSACTVSTGDPTRNAVKIGVSISTSGDFAADGQALQRGYELWVDAVNARGGLLGRPVQLVVLTDNSTPNMVTANYRALLREHVDLLFGPFSTLLSKPASDIANQAGYALVEGAGGGPSVFTRGLHNVFDVSLPVANNLVSFTDYILSLPQQIRPKTAAYATEDDPFTQPQVDLARTLLEKGGVKTVYSAVYHAPTNYQPFAEHVVASHADVVILGTLLPDVTAFIKTFQAEHYNPQSLIATAGPDLGIDFSRAIGGDAQAEGVLVPNGWYAGANTYENADFVQAYLARYGGTVTDINADAAESYSVGQVVEQAVTKLNTLNNQRLITELHTDTFNSVQGTVKFDETGQNTASFAYLFQWRQGTIQPVFPDFVAVENPEMKPKW